MKIKPVLLIIPILLLAPLIIASTITNNNISITTIDCQTFQEKDTFYFLLEGEYCVNVCNYRGQHERVNITNLIHSDYFITKKMFEFKEINHPITRYDYTIQETDCTNQTYTGNCNIKTFSGITMVDNYYDDWKPASDFIFQDNSGKSETRSPSYLIPKNSCKIFKYVVEKPLLSNDVKFDIKVTEENNLFETILDPVLGDAWDNEKEINLTMIGTVADLQVRMNITYDADMQPDFEDIRFLDQNKTAIMDHWIMIQEDSSWALVWVLVDNATNGTVGYMRYGNGGASNASDPNLTMGYWDDFDGTAGTLPDGWVDYGDASMEQDGSGIFECTGSSWCYANYATQTPKPIAIGTRIFNPTSTGLILSGSSGSAGSWYGHRGAGDTYALGERSGGSGKTNNDSGITLENNVWNIFDVKVTNGSQYFEAITTASDILIMHASDTTLDGTVLQYLAWNPLSNTDYDWVYTRKYIETEPTVTFGDEVNLANPPVMTWVSQDPSNLTELTISTLNITYNITDNDGVNDSTVLLYYWVNSSTTSQVQFVNGTAQPMVNNKTYDEKSGDLYSFLLSDNSYLAYTYNQDEDTYEDTVHDSGDLSGSSNMIKVELYNVSTTLTSGIFEYMINTTSGSNPAIVYYCNSTYSTGLVSNNPNCIGFDTVQTTNGFNHTHGDYSAHQISPFNINGSGFIGDVQVTSTSYFIISSNTATTWTYYTIPNISRTSATQTTTTSGNIWSDADDLDAHLHQVNDLTLYYFVSSADDVGDDGNSTTTNDIIDLVNLPPTSPNINSPNATIIFEDDINITWTESIPSEGLAISNYNVSLLNSDFSFNLSINASVGDNLYFNWASNVSISGGYYIVQVEATDNVSASSIGLSDVFFLNNTFNPETNQSTIVGSQDNVPIQGNCYILDLNNDTVTDWHYIWYKNGVNIENGTVTTDLTSNVLHNIVNVTAGNQDDGAWIFSCRGTTLGVNSSFLNSSEKTITGVIGNLTCNIDNVSRVHLTKNIEGFCVIDNDIDDYDCVGQVWSDEDKLIDTSPEVVTYRDEVKSTFKSINNMVNVYFPTNKLISGLNYTVKVRCTNTNGVSSYSELISFDFQDLGSVSDRTVFLLDNMSFGFLFVLVFFFLLSLVIIVKIVRGQSR